MLQIIIRCRGGPGRAIGVLLRAIAEAAPKLREENVAARSAGYRSVGAQLEGVAA